MSKITVVGSSNMDITVRTPHIPAKGETVFGGDVMMSFGGKGEIRLLQLPVWVVMSVSSQRWDRMPTADLCSIISWRKAYVLQE